MSEPVSNAEVEDVLASIRRLVSEEKRPTKSSQVAKPLTEVDTPKDDAALMLTPALRVSEDEDGPLDDALDADVASANQELVTDDVVAPDEAVDPDPENGSFADSEPDSSEEEKPTSATLDAYAFASQRERTSSAAVLDASLRVEVADHADVADSELDDRSEDVPAPTDASVAEFDKAVIETAPEADTPSVAEETNTAKEPEKVVFEHQASPPPPVFPTTADATEAPSMSLRSKIAALEEVIGRRRAHLTGEDTAADPQITEVETVTEAPSLDVELDADQTFEDEAEAYSFVVDADDMQSAAQNVHGFVFHEHRQPEMQADVGENAAAAETDSKIINMGFEPFAEPEDPASEPDTDLAVTDATQVFAVDEDVLDEEALRDMVAEIVRQELQGALGERITRNVRKLVRREIHRALATQDLD